MQFVNAIKKKDCSNVSVIVPNANLLPYRLFLEFLQLFFVCCCSCFYQQRIIILDLPDKLRTQPSWLERKLVFALK